MYIAAVYPFIGHGFEMIIKNFYTNVNKGCEWKHKNAEVIFVSCDNTEEEFNDHIDGMPYPLIPFGDDRITGLEENLDVESIPVVLILRKNGTIATTDARLLIQNKGAECLPDLLKIAEGVDPLKPHK